MRNQMLSIAAIFTQGNFVAICFETTEP